MKKLFRKLFDWIIFSKRPCDYITCQRKNKENKEDRKLKRWEFYHKECEAKSKEIS